MELSMRFPDTSQDVLVTCIVKGSERYVFLYTEKRLPELAIYLGRFATSSELSLSWEDVGNVLQDVNAKISRRVKPWPEPT